MPTYLVRLYSPFTLKTFARRVDASTPEEAKKKLIGKIIVDPDTYEFQVEELHIISVAPVTAFPLPPYELMSEEEVKRTEWLKGATVLEPLPKGAEPVGSPRLAAVIPDAITTLLFQQEVRSKCIRFLEPVSEFTWAGRKYGPYKPGDVECNLTWSKAREFCATKFKVLKSPPLTPLIDPKGRALREGEEITYFDPEDLQWAKLQVAKGNLQQITVPVAEWYYPEVKARIQYRRDIFTKFYEEAKRMARARKIEDAVLYLVENSLGGLTVRQIADALELCYDEETEILTGRGFIPFKDLTYEDEVATLNPETGNMEFLRPIAIFKRKYKGKMVHFKGKFYDLLVTPSHLMYVRVYPRRNQHYQFIPAIEIYKNFVPNKYELKRNASWIGKNVESFTLPSIYGITRSEKQKLREKAIQLYKSGFKPKEISEQLNVKRRLVENWVWPSEGFGDCYVWGDLDEIPIDLWLQFLAWYLAEGWTGLTHGKSCYVAIGQDERKNPSNYDEIVSICEQMGFTVTKCKGRIKIHNRQLYEYLKQFGYSRERYVPKWVKDLPPEKLRLFFDTMLKGDGTRDVVYFSKSKRLIDDMQEIAIKLGYSGIVFRHRDEYVLSIAKKENLTPIMYKKPELVDYEGYIYDVTVPKNHIILVRRNGKPVWSSNSYFTAFRAVKSWADPASAKQLEKEAEEQATLERWLPEQLEEVKRQPPAREPRILLGPLWRGQITLWPAKRKTEEELFQELKRILTLEGFPVMTPEEEAEYRRQLHEYWQKKARERLTYFLK